MDEVDIPDINPDINEFTLSPSKENDLEPFERKRYSSARGT